MEEEGFILRVILLIKHFINFGAVGVAFQEIALRIQFGKKLTSVPEVTEGQ